MSNRTVLNDMADVHTQQTTYAEFSRDATKVVTNSRDNTIKIIDLRMWKVEQELKGTSEGRVFDCLRVIS